MVEEKLASPPDNQLVLCQGQFLINPKEIWNIRADALATLLNLANISAYKRVRCMTVQDKYLISLWVTSILYL